MALKTKQSRFKEIAPGKMDTGGAPIYNNDLTMLQQNSDADFINSAEFYRRRLPALGFYNGGGPLLYPFKNGLILSGLTYDATNPALYVLNEGYFLSGGEVCYYPGGTFVPPNPNPFLVFLRKGAATYTNRVFNDGISKEITVVYSVIVETSQIAGPGLIMPSGTGIISTDEVVVISIKNGGTDNIGENYFTKDAALSLNLVKNRLKTNSFLTVGSLNAAVTIGDDDGFINFMASRVGIDGELEIQGAVRVVGSGAAALALFILDASAGNVFPVSPGTITFPVSLKVSGNYETGVARYLPFSRSLTISAPTIGPTPNTFTTLTVIYFNAKLMPAIPTAFEMPRDFLDVTP